MTGPTSPGALAALPDHVPAELVTSFDYRYAPEIASDPWRFMADRTTGPEIFWSTQHGGHWVVARTELVDEVFRRHDLFSNGKVSIPAPPRPQSIPASLDPPEHGKYRKIISRHIFSPKALGSLVDDVHTIGMELAADLAPRGECEFVADFARPLPVSLLLRMLGLPEDVRDTLVVWVRKMFHGDSVDDALEGYQESFAFLGRWLDDALAQEEPDGIVLPAYRAARVDDRPLTRDEMHSMAMMLLGAGVDTVTSQMTHCMRYVAENPSARQRLVDDPTLVPRAVEELLRRYGIANIARVVRSDMDYRGVPMRRGDLVLCSTALAGLDARTFPDPMTVDLDRPNVKDHMPFGAGPHLCPGAYLARVVLKSLLTDVLPQLPDLRIGTDAPLAHASGMTISLDELPLAWTAQGSR